jgi:ABC-type branched-subunit amino acid transport system ATPase component/branched-subunit amino acid ABC-type transport system permease component
MDKFLTLLISGAVSGAIYSLIASGLALTYATTGIFNLGFGGVAFTAAFSYYELNTGLGWPAAWAALVTLLVVGPLLGWALNKLIFGRLTRATEPAKVMVTVGILIALPALALWLVQLFTNDFHWNIPTGTQIFALPGVGPTPATVWHLGGGLTITSDQVIVFGVAAVLAVALWVLLRRTRLGLQMRAATNREDLASLMGINTGRSVSAAWIIGTTLAAVAGIVGGPILNSLTPEVFVLVVFVATAAVVLAGFTSIPRAFAAGLLLGIVQNLVAGYASFASSINGFKTSVPFLALLAALIFLGRSRERRAGTVAEEAVPASLAPDRSLARRTAGWLLPSLLLFGYLLFMANGYWLSVLTEGLALALVFMSFIVVSGLGGMVSLAQAAFVTAAGLTAGLLINHYHWPWIAGLLGGILIAMALGAVVALPALRVGGLALTLATLALAFLGDSVLFQWNWLSGGLSGWRIVRPSLLGLDFTSDRTYSVALALLLLLAGWLVVNLSRSTYGRQMIALRASEPAAASSGISPAMVKLRLFVISAAIAGAGGVLLVTADGTANNTTYVTQVGLVWLASVVLWGVRKPAAAVLAGLFATVFPALLSSGFTLPGWLGGATWSGTTSTWLPQMLFGLGAIGMAQNPEGLLGAGRRRRPAVTAPAGGTPSSAAGPVPATAGPSAPAAASAAALSLVDLSGGYGPLRVLSDVTLSLPAGTITALVGANGAGKSTLCKTIAGLLPPSAGRILVDGQDVTGQPAHRRSGRILLAPEARGVFPALTVDDNLAVRLPRPAERQRVYEGFPLLAERRQVAAGALSGGEQQILTMAPLLLKPPAVLIADEPTLGLAPRIVEQMLELFAQLRDNGTTLLLAEEWARSVLDLADQVILLELGRLVWSGPRHSLKDQQLAAIFLGSATNVAAPQETIAPS